MSQIKSGKSEILHYDTPDFPVFIRKNYIPQNIDFTDVPIHWHDEVEFIYVLQGNIGYLIDGKKIILHAGEGVFVNARHVHRILNGYMDCELLCLIFSPLILCTTKLITSRMVSPILTSGNLRHMIFSETVSWQKAILEEISAVYDCSLQECEELEIVAHLCRMWKHLVQNIEESKNKAEIEDIDLMQIKIMISYIQDNYSDRITLNNICASGDMGKNKCTALFKKYINMSPIDYLRYYRIEKSKELLRGTNMTITEIAYTTGFSGASYFAETFRKYIGCSPMQFREKKNTL